MIMIQKDKYGIELNKPAQESILELTKVLMCDFHYHYIKINDAKGELLFTYTDSLMHLKIVSKNVYENFCKDKDLFAFRSYSKESNDDGGTNNVIIGKIMEL